MNLQTVNSNRWKRMVYQYDLISGKVNYVAYQSPRGNTYYPDMFYHRYSYDAENRLTKAETSLDSVVWEKEARYDYYLHGPLARTTLGEQLVQGTDYGYTLQGWLKGVNAISLSTADFDMGNDGKVGTANQYVARDAMGFNLNYFASDYTTIKTGLNPFPDPAGNITGFRPLFNGNINSMAVSINFPSPTTAQVPQLYAYSYDQLNRITGMDVYRSATINANNWGTGLQTPLGDYKERTAYDANGNILKYLRQGFATTLAMDSLSYNYSYAGGMLINNKLNYVTDKIGGSTAHSTNYTEDIDDQATGNYVYDQIGNMIGDVKEGITNVLWNVYGKIKQVQRTATAANPVTSIVYTYDAGGNRISKQVTKSATDSIEYTWYVRDASGNIMSTYFAKGAKTGLITSANNSLLLTEQNMYGSSRLGVLNRNISVIPAFTNPTISNFIRGNKFFELSNHLGNVLVTISDKKVPHTTDGINVDYYNADIVTANDYYPFGMQMPGRTYIQGSSNKYRYGFNGKENDNEVKGTANQQDYGMRIYDDRLGKFLSVDPITKNYPELTPYQYASNTPVAAVDVDGLEGIAGPPLGQVYASNKNLYDDILAGKNTPRVQNSAKAGGIIVMAAALACDAFFTKGWATRTLLASQVFGAIEHNRANSPEGRVAQNERGKAALADAFITYGMGKIVGAGLASMGIIANETRSILKTTYSYGEATVTTQVGKSAVEIGRGGIGSGGYLEMEINVKKGFNGAKVASGSTVFEEIYKTAKVNAATSINGIRGVWNAGELGDNLTTFNKLILEKVNTGSMTMEQAALETFTGRMATSKGFTKVASISGTQNADNTYKSVNSIIFTK
jgi:RHS repeat-associated protein